MHAGTSVSPAQAPFDAAASIHQQPRQSARSNSLSSGSVVTIRRPASISRTRSDSPAGDAALIPLRLGSHSISSDHKRVQSNFIEPSNQASIAPAISSSGEVPGMSSVNRWSHSTTSSVGSLPHSRRNRSSSGAGAVLSSTRSSPQKNRRRQSAFDSQSTSLTTVPPLQTTPALTDPNDTESLSTSQTVSTPPVPSPERHDYFGSNEGLAQYGMAKSQQRAMMVRNQTAPVPVKSRTMSSGKEDSVHHPSSAPRDEHEQKAKWDGDHRRTREKTEKDKKAMLSKALQKANTAVLLDNAQNYEGALEAYGDACELLGQVMNRTSGDDDKRKLDAIRVTYSNRMEELQQLVEEMPLIDDEKDLPARPMSAASQPLSPNSSVLNKTGIDDALHEHVVSPATLAPEQASAPRLSYARNDRDSFFARTMAAVENSTGFQSESEEERTGGERAVTGAEEIHEEAVEERPAGQGSIHLPPSEMDQYMPRPLSPRRVQLPTDHPHVDDAWDGEAHHPQSDVRESARSRSNSKDSVSWLDTIDESASSCSDSVHSFSSQQEVRRKHIRGISGVTDPDFDAAFDAAVEAAYDEGLEPDMEARTKQMAAYRQRQNESVHIPASGVGEIVPGALRPSRAVPPDPDEEEEEEEERILDEMTNEYGQGFNFDLQTKSALPRQSDSSGYSRSTWQSSQMSDRATAATSLSTVAEDGVSHRISKVTPIGTRIDPTALPPATAPPRGSLPPPPSAGNISRLSTVRSRRLSNINSKQLKIETTTQSNARKRASTFHNTSSPFLEEHEGKDSSEQDSSVEQNLSSAQHDHLLRSPPSLELHTALDDTNLAANSTVTDFRPSYEPVPGELLAARPDLFRKSKSSASLRDHAEHTVLLASPDPEASFPTATPMSTTFMSFAARRNNNNNNNNSLTSQRATLPSNATDSHMAGGIYLFDTSLSAASGPMSPRSPNSSPQPNGLEPCPESFMLRPFWLMRALSSTIMHPKGGFLTTKTFVPREVWQSTGVKLKVVEDKIANCDLLTAALGRLAGVDTYDADAIMDELQSFEEVMERVQVALSKKLGSDVGVHGVAGMFKDASAANVASTTMGNAASDNAVLSDKATKSNSGKSYLSSWRKLRNKSSGTPLSTGSQISSKLASGKDQHTMPSVPMTSFVPVERRGNRRDARNLVFEGPNKEYMGSLARLFDGVQVLDQIARQVEDPGLKHSSPTHVGLELSIRHAAEFFGFYVCRFVLADLGLLMDKFVKKGTEWVLA